MSWRRLLIQQHIMSNIPNIIYNNTDINIAIIESSLSEGPSSLNKQNLSVILHNSKAHSALVWHGSCKALPQCIWESGLPFKKVGV